MVRQRGSGSPGLASSATASASRPRRARGSRVHTVPPRPMSVLKRRPDLPTTPDRAALVAQPTGAPDELGSAIVDRPPGLSPGLVLELRDCRQTAPGLGRTGSPF